jgi:hypothetical protein
MNEILSLGYPAANHLIKTCAHAIRYGLGRHLQRTHVPGTSVPHERVQHRSKGRQLDSLAQRDVLRCHTGQVDLLPHLDQEQLAIPTEVQAFDHFELAVVTAQARLLGQQTSAPVGQGKDQHHQDQGPEILQPAG